MEQQQNVITIETLKAFSDVKSLLRLLFENKNNLTKDDFLTLCELLKRSFDEHAIGLYKDYILISYYEYIFMLYELCNIMQKTSESDFIQARETIHESEMYILQKTCDYIKSTNK